jgi:PKD repeat protein
VIVGRDNINFTYSSSCGSPVVTFTNNTLPMAGSTISSLKWEFGDGRDSTNDVNPIVHDYTATQNITLYTVKLSTVNSYGCNSSDVLQVDISGGIKPNKDYLLRHTVNF